MRIKLAHPSVGLCTHAQRACDVTLGITKASRGSRRDVILKAMKLESIETGKHFFFFHLAVDLFEF